MFDCAADRFRQVFDCLLTETARVIPGDSGRRELVDMAHRGVERCEARSDG